jgi:hypothetical protein
MATRSLSPKRALERRRQHRACVLTLALQAAQRTIRAQLRAEGRRIHDLTYRELRLRAEEYFEAHKAELIGEAAVIVATSPGFERWRLPTTAEIKDAQTCL